MQSRGREERAVRREGGPRWRGCEGFPFAKQDLAVPGPCLQMEGHPVLAATLESLGEGEERFFAVSLDHGKNKLPLAICGEH